MVRVSKTHAQSHTHSCCVQFCLFHLEIKVKLVESMLKFHCYWRSMLAMRLCSRPKLWPTMCLSLTPLLKNNKMAIFQPEKFKPEGSRLLVVVCQSAPCQAGKSYCAQSDCPQTSSRWTAPYWWHCGGGCPSMHWTQQPWRASSSPGRCCPRSNRPGRVWKTQSSPKHRQWHRWEGSSMMWTALTYHYIEFFLCYITAMSRVSSQQFT